MSYAWVVNVSKENRAIKELTDKKKIDPKIEVTEEAVKEIYIRLGGLVMDDVSDKDEEVIEVPVVRRGRPPGIR